MPSGIYQRTDEMRKNMSIAAKKAGTGKWWNGKKHTEESKKKMSEIVQERLKNLIRKERQERNDSAYGNWRLQVYKRDNFKCKINNCDCSGRIIAHHILNWSEFPELRYEVNNGITLCQAHHPKKRAEEKQATSFFNELLAVNV